MSNASIFLNSPETQKPVLNPTEPVEIHHLDTKSFGIAIVLAIIIVLTIFGNILVIFSVFTSKVLRIVQNFYIVSLAVADITVAVLVMPFAVANLILGHWIFGKILCKLWLTCDVMCCTSSILSLCVIALDRFQSITQPIDHAQSRTKCRVLTIIGAVWLISFLISSPPLLGWNNWPETFNKNTSCDLTTIKSYVIYSAVGSFFIPLLIMTIVYIKIYVAMRFRLRQRAFVHTLYPTSVSETYPQQQMQSNHLKIQRIKQRLQNAINLKYEADEEAVVVDAAADKNNSNKCKTVPSRRRSVLECNNSNENVAHHKNFINRHQSLNDLDQLSRSIKFKFNKIDLMPSSMKNCLPDQSTHQHKKSQQQSTAFKNAFEFRRQQRKLQRIRERRAARTLSVIMGAFVICWLPFFLMYIIGPFCATWKPSEDLKYFVTWLGYINSGLNPIIYTIFNLDYRKAFKRLLTHSFKR